MHPALTAAPDAASLLRALRRCWLLALLCAIIGAAGVTFTAVQLLPPPKHMARTLLQISDKKGFIFPTGESQATLDRHQRTQIVLVKSRLVLSAALSQPEVAKLRSIQTNTDPVHWLEKAIKVDFTLGPGILSISLSGDNPQQLVTIVNAVAKAYIDKIVDKDRIANQARLQELKKISSQLAEKARAKQKALRKVALAAGSGDAKNLIWKQSIVMQQLARARKEQDDTESEIRKLRVQLNAELYQEQGLLSDCTAALIACTNSPVSLALVGLLQSRLIADAHSSTAVESEKHTSEKYLKEHPNYEKIVARVRDLKARIKALLGTSVPGTATAEIKSLELELATAQTELQAERKELAKSKTLKLRRDLSSLEHLQKALKEDVERLEREIGFNNESTIEVEEIREKIGHEEDLMRKVDIEIEKLEWEQRAPSEHVMQIEEAALFPGQPGRKEMAIIGGSGAGTFGLVLFVFAWLEFRRRRVSSSGEVVHGLGIRLIGTVPDINQTRRRLLSYSSSRVEVGIESMLANSVDATRTMLLHAAQKQGIKVVLITSAVAGEGKTSTAAHLCASLGRAGRKTLLIDADLRKPHLHRLFNALPAPGFSELIQGQCAIDQAIQQTSVANVSLLCAGSGDAQAIQALSHDFLSEIFAHLRQQYDFVVVDCSPILPVPDSLALAPHADAAILAVLRDVSRLPTVYAAYQRLTSVGVHILGAVVNGANDDIYYSSYAPAVAER